MRNLLLLPSVFSGEGDSTETIARIVRIGSGRRVELNSAEKLSELSRSVCGRYGGDRMRQSALY